MHTTQFKRRVGNRLRAHREARGLSQTALARMLTDVGGDGSQISRWERGHAFPTLTNLCALAQALEITEEELLCGSCDEPSSRRAA